MAKLTPTTADDLPQIEEWIKADPFHQNDPKFTAPALLTGHGELAFCLQDDEGPLCFVGLAREDDMLRLSTQFGPSDIVSKRRLVTGLLSTGIPAIVEFGKQRGFRGVVFESTNPSLIAFMGKQNFVLDKGDDYALRF